MHRSTIALILGAAGALFLVGCGAAPAATTPAPVATATPTAVPTATPTPDLTPAAAAAYLAAATTVNAGFTALNKAYPASMSLAQAKRYWSQAEKLDRTALTTIFAIAYPASMETDVNAMIAAQTKVVADDSALAADPNDKAAYAANTTDTTAASAASNVVRRDLGLPQIPLT
jgi:hypothetical protein